MNVSTFRTSNISEQNSINKQSAVIAKSRSNNRNNGQEEENVLRSLQAIRPRFDTIRMEEPPETDRRTARKVEPDSLEPPE